MTRQIGVCTWTFGDRPLSDVAGRIARLGFDGVELLGDLTRYSALQAKEILDDHGLRVFSLTPENVDISHPLLHQKGVDYYKRLLDFAAELGEPLVSCHGLVSRIAAVSSPAEEEQLLIAAVQQICDEAQQRGLRIVFELLNRYETHQVQTVEMGLKLLEDVNQPNLGLLLDAYHMNIEEANPVEAIHTAGKNMWLYHTADSNRQGIGRGHTDFPAQMDALAAVGYTGPLILECTAPGPNPFTPVKGGNWLEILEQHLIESMKWLTS